MIWFFICALALLCSVFLAHSQKRQNAQKDIASYGAALITRGVIFICLPASALVLYAYLGNPNLPDQPLRARLSQPLDQLPEAAILAKLELRLYAHPDDEEGWRLLARLQAGHSMAQAAADSWRQVVRLVPDDGEALFGLIAALIAGDEGLIGAPAQSLIDRAQHQFPTHPMTLYYAGLSARQQGQPDLARTLWQKAIAAFSPTDPRRAFIMNQMEQAAP